jgi:hypothetical protein
MCNSDKFILLSNSDMICSLNGQWLSENSPKCIEKNCSLDKEEYSKTMYTIFSTSQLVSDVNFVYPVNTKIQIVCTNGYQLIANHKSKNSIVPQQLTCKMNGIEATWNDYLPLCRPGILSVSLMNEYRYLLFFKL